MRNPNRKSCAGAQDIKEAADAGEKFEPGSLAWAGRQIEQVKAGLRHDLGQAYSAEFTRAAEILREHDPVQFNSLRRLLKDKQVRLGDFDRLIHQRQCERMQKQKRAGVAAARTARATTAAVARPRRMAPQGTQVRRYPANAQGLFLLECNGQGAPPIKLPLANFSARIVTEIQRDDGLNCAREFELEARLKGQTRRFVVAAAQFPSMKWVIDKVGARAVIFAGLGVRDRVREAIQLLSSAQLVERTVYTHTGWRKLGTEWVYLHGGGALSATGPRVGIETLLPAPLAPFALPPPPKGVELRSAISASLALLDLAPDRVTAPTLGAVWRGILGAVDFSVFVYGATGRFKTALAALIQQHFGAEFAADRLPGSWASTANFNESLAFIAKDAVIVVDDFRPARSAGEREPTQRDADRLLRAAANGAGRGRLKSDASLQSARPPRALILSTGEEKPSGESLIARMFLVEVAPGEIDPQRLSACQRDAAGGLYAKATAGYAQWLASKLDEVRAGMSAAHSRYREQAAQEGLHRRTPGIVAGLFIGWEQFFSFAVESGVLTHGEAEGYRSRVWRALVEVARRQSEHQREADPVDRFLGLLRSAISAGHAQLAARDGGVPDNPGTWGWRAAEQAGDRRRAGWLPRGACVGWLDGRDLFLDIDSAYRAAQAAVADGDSIAVGVQTLVKRLHESNQLKSVDEKRGKLRVRRVLGGCRQEVLHLDVDVLTQGIVHKTSPTGPSRSAKNDLRGSSETGRVAWANGVT